MGRRKEPPAERFSVYLQAIPRSLSPLSAYSWDRLLEAKDARARFCRYLVEMYHYVKFSCPLMELVASRLDTGYGPVIDYLKRHIEEERGHEEWVLNDLEALGYERERVRRSLPARETIALIGTQLYMLQVLNPIGYLGYIYALESNPPTIESVNALSQRLGIPLTALFTLTEHAKSDPQHLADLNRILDSEVITREAQGLIAYNVKATLENLADLVLAVALREKAD